MACGLRNMSVSSMIFLHMYSELSIHHYILTHVFRAFYRRLLLQRLDLAVSVSVCEVRGMWERVNRGAPPSMAISEACDSHKDS